MKICDSCHGGCCRSFKPDITGIDMINIVQSLKFDINFFVTAIPVFDKYLKFALGKKPLFIFTDSAKEQYYRFSLKMEQSRIFAGTYKCIFLNEFDGKAQESKLYDNVISRCGIYHARPLTCRTFPAQINPEIKQAIMFNPYNISSPDDHPAYRLCYRPITKEDYEQFQEQMFKNLVAYDYEMLFFLKLSEKWNKNPDSSDYFLDFMLKEYKNRIEHVAEK